MAKTNTNILELFYIGAGMLMIDAALYLLMELLLMDLGEHHGLGSAPFQNGMAPLWQHMVPFGIFAWAIINILLIFCILCTARRPYDSFLYSRRKRFGYGPKSSYLRISNITRHPVLRKAKSETRL